MRRSTSGTASPGSGSAQHASCTGSVHARKTRVGGARNERSTRSGARGALAACASTCIGPRPLMLGAGAPHPRLIEVRGKTIELVVPEPAVVIQPEGDAAHRCGAQSDAPHPPVAPPLDEPSALENRQVLAD